MEAKRRFATARVVLWFTGPVFVALFLVAWGIHLGSVHRGTVRHFSWRFLGVGAPPDGESEAPAPHAREAKRPAGVKPVSDQGAAGGFPSTFGRPQLSAAEVGSRSSDGTEAPAGSQPQPNALPGVAAHKGTPSAPSPSPRSADAVGTAASDLSADRLSVPVQVRVKLLVDDRWAAHHADWLLRVQRSLAAASEAYQAHFGIQLSLTGAVLWSGPRMAHSQAEAYRDLCGHPREGADVLLGLLGQPLSADGYGLGAPAPSATLNGAYGLVGLAPHAPPSSQPGARSGAGPGGAHTRGILRSLGHLLGGREVLDPNSQAFALGTWMSAAPPPSGRPPWVDLDNRRRILLRKGLPFVPEGP